MEALVFIILETFFATCMVLKFERYHLDIPQLGKIRKLDAFRPIMQGKIFDGLQEMVDKQ